MTPLTDFEVNGFILLEEKGLVEKRSNGKYDIADAGRAFRMPKMGRPTLIPPRWLEFINYFGGTQGFLEEVGISYASLNRWALHGVRPSGAALKKVLELAQREGVQPPFDQ